MNIYKKSKHASTNDGLPKEIKFMFGINVNSSSAERKDSTNLDTVSDIISL